MHTISRIPESGGNTAAIRHPVRYGILARLQDAIGLIMLWRARSRTRRSLSKLDNRLLRDVGLTPEEAFRESAKPFWRA